MKVDIIKSFKQNHEVWLALNHYLPPELLFELFSVIARNLNTDFPINKLFDSNTKSKTIGVKRNFFPKEIKKNNPVQKELRSLLLTILHNRDDFSEVGLEDRKSEVNKFIQICRLGATDFIAFKEYLDFSNYIVTSNFEKFLKIFQYHSSNYNIFLIYMLMLTNGKLRSKVIRKQKKN